MMIIQHKFVEFIPEIIEEKTLYISIEYCTAIHKCVCGCGNEVVTPISPTDWELHFNGKTVSLTPSIGNWNYNCKSHYYITQNKIHYARRWHEKKIEETKQENINIKKRLFNALKLKNNKK